MTLLAPWALWFSAVAAAVVGLYLLKVRRERVVVPALDFWLELVSQSELRSLFQRLKRWLSLLLWLLIVVLLVLALGNPLFAVGTMQPRSIAVILDNSASMQAFDEPDRATTRFAAAHAAVREITAGRPVADEWLLIEAGAEPRVRHNWTRQRASVVDALAEIEPFYGAADLQAAVDLADQLLVDRARPTIVLVSDGDAGRVAELSESDERIVHWPIGNRADNVGIVACRARLHREQARHYVYVRVHNASDAERDIELVFEIDDNTAAVVPQTLAPGASWDDTVPLTAPQGGVLRVSLESDDALPLDNQAYAILEPIQPAVVLLVTPRETAFFFEQALAAMDPLIDVAAGRTLTLAAYEQLSPEQRTAPDLTIFNNCSPDGLPAEGRFVFVNDWPADLPARKIGTLTAPTMRLSAPDHPLARHVRFGAVTLAAAHDVDLLRDATPLATTPAGRPLLFEVREPRRQALVLAFDVMTSDLPFRNAFPILLRNAVAHLHSDAQAWVAGAYAIGDVITPLRPLPSELDRVTVAASAAAADSDDTADAANAETQLPVRGGSFVYADTASPTALRFTIADELAYTAVNLANERETRLAPRPPPTPPTEVLPLTKAWLGWPPWLGLTALALLLVATEWLTYHYRWTE